MSSQHSDTSPGGGRGLGRGIGGPGGRGGGPEAERAPGAMAAAAQEPVQASTTGSSTMSEWRTVSYLPSSTHSFVTTPEADAEETWSSNTPREATPPAAWRPATDSNTALAGSLTFEPRVWASHSDSGSDSSDGDNRKGPCVTGTEPPECGSPPKRVSISVQESLQPLSPSFQESERSTSLEPSSSSEMSIRDYGHRSSLGYIQDSVLIPSAPQNTPQGPSEESLPSLLARSPQVLEPTPVQFMGPSLESIRGSLLQAAVGSERGSLLEATSSSDLSLAVEQGSSPPPSVFSTAVSSAQERFTPMDSQVAGQGPDQSSVFSTPRSWSQEAVTIYSSSLGLAAEARPLQHAGPQAAFPLDSSQLMARMPTQRAPPSATGMPMEASGPPQDTRGLSAQVSVPPPGQDAALQWVEELAPPPGSGEQRVEERSPPWASLSRWDTVDQSMASREKASVSGHMFDVVVIGGGISGQCEPYSGSPVAWSGGWGGGSNSALAFGEGILFRAFERVQ